MKFIIKKAYLFFFKKDLRIDTKYKLNIKVFETDIPHLEENQTLATVNIDTRINFVEETYIEILKNPDKYGKTAEEVRILREVKYWIEDFCRLIKLGQISIRYLIENSDIEIVTPKYEKDGKEYSTSFSQKKDYLLMNNKLDENKEILKNEEGIILLWYLKFKIEVEKKKWIFNGKEVPNLYDF